MAKQKRTVGELEDELKARDRRIEELREEIDELRDLVTRLREHDEDTDNVFESWKEAFGMEMTEDGIDVEAILERAQQADRQLQRSGPALE
jgi:hypothetical protein